MTETAIVAAMAFSVVYFFMFKELLPVIPAVWAMTDKPPKEMSHVVIRIFEVEETADWEASIWIPVVISRRPARRA